MGDYREQSFHAWNKDRVYYLRESGMLLIYKIEKPTETLKPFIKLQEQLLNIIKTTQADYVKSQQTKQEGK